MIQYLQYLFPYFIQYKYWALFGALSAAGLGVPLPEELSLVLGGYLVAIGHLEFFTTLGVCYAGVVVGDVFTYTLGRFAGHYFLDRRWSRWIITRQRLAQVQYYYRRYGPWSILGGRQVAGLRFPTFFTAGMLKMRFWVFLLYDATGALISMPLVFFLAYWFGPRLGDALSLVFRIRDYTLIGVLTILGSILGLALLYRYIGRRESEDSVNDDVNAPGSRRSSRDDG